MNRLIACLNVYNEAEFIERCLNAYIRQVDGVVVVDGAYADYPHDHPWSTDGTLTIVEDICHRHGVPCTVVTTNDAWPSQIEKRNAYLDCVNTGDWVFITDGDWETRFLYGAIDAIKRGSYDAYKITRQFMDEHGILHQVVWGNPYIIRKVAGMHYVLNHYTIEDADGVNVYFPPYRVGDLSDRVKSFHWGEYRATTRTAENQRFYTRRVEQSSGLESFGCDVCGLHFRLCRGDPSMCPRCGDRHPSAPLTYEGLADRRSLFHFYNAIAAKYPETEQSFQGAVGQRRIDAIHDLLSDHDGVILDLGCHDGFFADTFPQYVGMDIALPALQRMTAPRVWADAEAPALPFRDECIHVVMALEVLEHLYRRYELLQECYRILVAGGRLILSVPYGTNPWQIVTFAAFSAYGIPNRAYLHGQFTEPYVTRLLTATGFTVQRCWRLEGSFILMVEAQKPTTQRVTHDAVA